MSRPGKGARLWLRPEKRNPDGTLRERAVWVIRDGPHKISTGCPPEDRSGAERALGEHLADKYKPNRAGGRHPSEILIADVLAIYLTDIGQNAARNTVNETRQTGANVTKIADISRANSYTPRSGRGGRRFKSCHSDQGLAEIQTSTGTDCGTVSSDAHATLAAFELLPPRPDVTCG
jgi:hypothetical protein